MKKPRIAFVGSSPITMLYVDRLSKSAECVIFEGGHLGGAWSETKISGALFPRANNIVCPLSAIEEKFIDDIEKEFLSKDAKIFKQCAPLNLAVNYKPKQYILGHFLSAVPTILKNENVSLRRQYASFVEINKQKVSVNGQKFNAIIFPSNCFFQSLTVNGLEIKVGYETIVSKHIRVASSDGLIGPYYSENFDNVFDRGGIMPSSPNIFVGRVRRELKSGSLEEIVGQSNFIKNNKETLDRIELNHYHNHRLDESELLKLRSILKDSSAFCIETRQFVNAFSKISTSLALINQRLFIQGGK